MNRPTGLTIIAWLAIIGGGLQILGSLGLVGVGSLGVLMGSTGAIEATVLLGMGLEIWTGIALIAIGVLGAAVGFGVLGLRPWAWTWAVVLYAVNLVAGIALLLSVGLSVTPVFTSLMSAVILAYLFSAPAREALGHQAGGGATPHAPHPAA